MTHETGKDLSPQQNLSWFAVFVTEFIVISVINTFTIIAFARNRHLRKRTTYLIINLTVADLLVGSVTGPLEVFYPEIKTGRGFSLQEFLVLTVYNIFPVSSLANLSFIALERLHATLYPFKHFSIGKLVYLKTIIGCWSLALLLASLDAVLVLYDAITSWSASWALAIVLTLLILTISYVIIIVKVTSNPPPQDVNLVVSNRKLSVTLLMVTVVSILTTLPRAIRAVIPHTIWHQISPVANDGIAYTVLALYYASSIINPLIYAIRMKEFRKVAKELLCGKAPELRHVEHIELHAM